MMRNTLLLLILLLSQATMLLAQNFTEEEWLQGYAVRESRTIFLFKASLYRRKPHLVTVTGSFRGWNQDLNDKQWLLSATAGDSDTWTLAVDNPNYSKIMPSAEFKYRIDEGEWLSPPAGAPNEKGGNLVFLKGIKPPTLRAELTRSGTIWAYIEGTERPLAPAAYRLSNAQGEAIPIAEVLPNTSILTLIKPAQPIDIKRVYFLEIPTQKLKCTISWDAWFREMYSDKELGANVSADGKATTFRLFAPRAEMVKLYLYKNHTDQEAYCTLELQQDADGVWETTVPGNQQGVYYDYTVHGAKDPGNAFYETNPVHISDPYARVSMDSYGKCRVWERTRPATPLKGGRPKMQDVIAYEVHVEDFTNLLPVPEPLKGTIPAFTRTGLKNKKGAKIGFDYLIDLGINVVHLMPMQEFLHWDSADWRKSFENDPFMREQGIHLDWYEWGYRTSHAFAVEHRYRAGGTEPGAERNQFRDLVQAFHDKGMAVIIDIVPNHTAENMDGQNMLFHFNAIDKHYYYRTRDLNHIGEYGNEVKTENRPMTQRWLIDQCRHWIEEFGIDGFRIDLAGQVDQQTLKKLRQALGDDIIIYGEPWIGSNDPAYEENPDWDWYKADSPITFFQDDARNAFKGPVSNPQNKKTDRGWAGGNAAERERVKLGLTAKFPEETSPLSGINYLDIHDNWALADQFARNDWDGRKGVDEDNFKIAAVLLYTSQGPIVTHGGTEIMRSKGIAELKETVKTTLGGIKVYLHGKRDTYNMRNANLFLWENVGKSPATDADAACDYAGMYAFWRGLNKLRLSEAGKVFRNDKAIPDDYYQWIQPENPLQLGYIVNNRILVLLNPDEKANPFTVALPEGDWVLIGNNTAVDHLKGVKDANKKLERLVGGKSHNLSLPAAGIKIWLKK